jgi:hypothetical protein
LYAGEACRCEVTGGEKGLARAFFCRLDACIVVNRVQKTTFGSLHSVTAHIVQQSFDAFHHTINKLAFHQTPNRKESISLSGIDVHGCSVICCLMGDREKKTQIEEKKILHNDLTVRLPD